MGLFASLRSWFSSAPAPAPLSEPPVVTDETPKADRLPPPQMAFDAESVRVMMEAMARQFGGQTGELNFNPFDPKRIKPPPGVGPKGVPLAMDDAGFGSAAAWASDGIAGLLGPREGFIGYPQLALMAQRPEYRSPVEIVGTESTRAGLKFQAVGDADKAAKIAELEQAFREFEVMARLREMSLHDGFYGRAHLYIDTGDDDDPEELKLPIGNGADEMSKLKIAKGSLVGLRSIEPVWVWPVNYDSQNPRSPHWYKPQKWFVMADQVHSSRLLTFISRPVPDLLKPAYMFGGQALTQMMVPVVENWLSTRKAVGEIVKKYSHLIFKGNVTEAINSGNVQNLLKRVALFSTLRNNNGVMLLDNSTEDFGNVSVPLGGLEMLQAQAQEHMASLPRIPLIKLAGIQPAGLNASSVGELRAFADNINSYQEAFYRPHLTTIKNIIECHLWGAPDPEITFTFNPLVEALDELQRAQAAQQVVSAMVGAFESGLIGRADALKTLRSLGQGLGLSIDDKMIREAENEPPTPSPEELTAQAAVIKAERPIH
jgi:uncharacterized protein